MNLRETIFSITLIGLNERKHYFNYAKMPNCKNFY